MFPDATVKFGAVGSVDSIRAGAFDSDYDVVVSCLASRTGGIKDSWDVDYQATKNVLDVAREKGAKHFVLLSAICVQKPLLTFQAAKLKFEEELQSAGTSATPSSAPPRSSSPSRGRWSPSRRAALTSCSETASWRRASHLRARPRQVHGGVHQGHSLENKVLPIGGPGEAMSA